MRNNDITPLGRSLVLSALEQHSVSKSSRRYVDWAWTWLPYALARIDGDQWLPLNRRYKPIGIDSSEWVDYEDYRNMALDASELDLTVCTSCDESNTRRWLWSPCGNDSPFGTGKARRRYEQRLRQLVRG